MCYVKRYLIFLQSLKYHILCTTIKENYLCQVNHSETVKCYHELFMVKHVQLILSR